MAYREVEAGKGPNRERSPTKANNIHREKEKYPKSKKNPGNSKQRSKISRKMLEHQTHRV